MEVARKMEMEMVMVIFGARKASSELRFASKWLLTSDFEVLEASGAPKGDQERPKKFPKAPKKLPRSLQEAPKRLLGGVLGVLGGSETDECIEDRGLGSFLDLQELPKHLQGASWEPLEGSSGASWGLLGSFLGLSWSPLVLQMLPEPQNLMSRAILMQI